MTKLSFLIMALLSLFALTVSVTAQDEVELILEEVEGGYLIVNWEDTRTVHELPEECQTPPIIVQEMEEIDE